MLKKLVVSWLPIICMIFCLSACGITETESNPTNTPNESQMGTTQNADEILLTEPENSKENLEESEEVKLSDDCDKVLASGYDAENNYYELVANETEDYSGTEIEMGILKNNEWVIPLTSKSPFVSESGLLVAPAGVDGRSIYDETFAIFNYVGAGCFYYEDIIWNGNTKESYTPTTMEADIVIKGKKPVVNNDGQFIISEFQKNYKLLDVNTMSIKEINLCEDGWDIDYCFPYSEGLFACMNHTSDKETNGFYDINGKKVIDLSKYKLAKNSYYFSGGGNSGPSQDLVFKNGECTFTITNDQDTDYIITIDKAGNVINSVEA